MFTRRTGANIRTLTFSGLLVVVCQRIYTAIFFPAVTQILGDGEDNPYGADFLIIVGDLGGKVVLSFQNSDVEFLDLVEVITTAYKFAIEDSCEHVVCIYSQFGW